MIGRERTARHASRLKTALADGDWATVGRVRNVFKRSFLRSMVTGDGEAVESILVAVAEQRADFVRTRRLRPTIDAASTEARLAGDVELFALGKEMRPANPALDAAASNAKEAVLATLGRANRGMSNLELANRLGYAAETIARALSVLRVEGAVVSIRIGRESINSIVKLGGDRPRPRAELLVEKLSGKLGNRAIDLRPAEAPRSAVAISDTLSQPQAGPEIDMDKIVLDVAAIPRLAGGRDADLLVSNDDAIKYDGRPSGGASFGMAIANTTKEWLYAGVAASAPRPSILNIEEKIPLTA